MCNEKLLRSATVVVVVVVAAAAVVVVVAQILRQLTALKLFISSSIFFANLLHFDAIFAQCARNEETSSSRGGGICKEVHL